ncbi:hypothetical protein HK405_007330, partial [Cladochytrium tenue]
GNLRTAGTEVANPAEPMDEFEQDVRDITQSAAQTPSAAWVTFDGARGGTPMTDRGADRASVPISGEPPDGQSVSVDQHPPQTDNAAPDQPHPPTEGDAGEISLQAAPDGPPVEDRPPDYFADEKDP